MLPISLENKGDVVGSLRGEMSGKPRKEGIGVEENVHSPMKGASYISLAKLDGLFLWAWTVSGVTGVRRGEEPAASIRLNAFAIMEVRVQNRTVKTEEVSLVTVFPFPSVEERPNRKQLEQSESWIFFGGFVLLFFRPLSFGAAQRHLQQAARYFHSSFFRPFDRRESGPPPLADR
jgi:hypothetical protein